MAIGTGWKDGAWVDAAWVTAGDGAWSQVANIVSTAVRRVKTFAQTCINLMDN